jgi:hypothetical protein
VIGLMNDACATAEFLKNFRIGAFRTIIHDNNLKWPIGLDENTSNALAEEHRAMKRNHYGDGWAGCAHIAKHPSLRLYKASPPDYITEQFAPCRTD